MPDSTDNSKKKLFNDGHLVTRISGTDFDGYITCLKTNEERRHFVFQLGRGGEIAPVHCPICRDRLTPAVSLEGFQRPQPPEDYREGICAG